MPQSIAIDNQLGRTSVAYCAVFSFISSSDICRSGIVEEIVAGSETKYTILPQKTHVNLWTLVRVLVEAKPMSGTLGVMWHYILDGTPVHRCTPYTHKFFC